MTGRWRRHRGRGGRVLGMAIWRAGTVRLSSAPFYKKSLDQEMQVHKGVVCSASGLFQAADESQMKESETGAVRLEDFRAITIERVLSFVYTQDYAVDGEEIIKEADAVESVALELAPNFEEVGGTEQAIANDFHQRHFAGSSRSLYRAADVLQIPGFVQSASERCSRAHVQRVPSRWLVFKSWQIVARPPVSVNETLRWTWKVMACSHIGDWGSCGTPGSLAPGPWIDTGGCIPVAPARRTEQALPQHGEARHPLPAALLARRDHAGDGVRGRGVRRRVVVVLRRRAVRPGRSSGGWVGRAAREGEAVEVLFHGVGDEVLPHRRGARLADAMHAGCWRESVRARMGGGRRQQRTDGL